MSFLTLRKSNVQPELHRLAQIQLTGNMLSIMPIHSYVSQHVKLLTALSVYYVKNQLDATLAVLFISHCKITLHVSDAFCVHHQEY